MADSTEFKSVSGPSLFSRGGLSSPSILGTGGPSTDVGFAQTQFLDLARRKGQQDRANAKELLQQEMAREATLLSMRSHLARLSKAQQAGRSDDVSHKMAARELELRQRSMNKLREAGGIGSYGIDWEMLAQPRGLERAWSIFHAGQRRDKETQQGDLRQKQIRQAKSTEEETHYKRLKRDGQRQSKFIDQMRSQADTDENYAFGLHHKGGDLSYDDIDEQKYSVQGLDFLRASRDFRDSDTLLLPMPIGTVRPGSWWQGPWGDQHSRKWHIAPFSNDEASQILAGYIVKAQAGDVGAYEVVQLIERLMQDDTAYGFRMQLAITDARELISHGFGQPVREDMRGQQTQEEQMGQPAQAGLEAPGSGPF